jgi:hypothetical protein
MYVQTPRRVLDWSMTLFKHHPSQKKGLKNRFFFKVLQGKAWVGKKAPHWVGKDAPHWVIRTLRTGLLGRSALGAVGRSAPLFYSHIAPNIGCVGSGNGVVVWGGGGGGAPRQAATAPGRWGG